jgi:hypothetical protein
MLLADVRLLRLIREWRIYMTVHSAIVNSSYQTTNLITIERLYLSSRKSIIMQSTRRASACPFHPPQSTSTHQRPRKARSSFSELAAEIFTSKIKSKSKNKSKKQSLDIPSSSESRPLSPPPSYSSLHAPSTQNSRRSSFTPFRPSEPWTNPPNQKSEIDHITSPSSFNPASASRDRQYKQESDTYKPATAWEKIGERRARDIGVVW